MTPTAQSAEPADVETTQVLTFDIGSQAYCIELQYVTEITDGGELTSVPNTPEHIAGVMDLRGQATTIVNLLAVLGAENMNTERLATEGGTETHRIIVLDEQAVDVEKAVGWLVSSVADVSEIPIDTLEAEGVTDAAIFRGVVEQDNNDEFLLWLDPREVML